MSISNKRLLAELETAIDDEEKTVIYLSTVIKKKVIGSSLPEKEKSRLLEILEILKKDSMVHYKEVSDIFIQINEEVQ